MKNPINVFFPYYQCGDLARQKEIDLCLANNTRNPLISKLIVIIDDGSDIPVNSSKLEVVRLPLRPTYRKWVELSSSEKGISLLCNSDIYFDESLDLVESTLSKSKTFLALSRWELVGGNVTLHPNPHWSQDVWGIRCEDKFSEEMLQSLDFPMGVPRCDNKVAYIFATRGWTLKNPCSQLKSVHVHETQMRSYDKKLDQRILGGVAYVYPSETLQSNAKLDLDIWTMRSSDVKAVTLNKSMEGWIAEQERENIINVRTRNDNALIIPDLEYAAASEVVRAMTLGEKVFNKNYHFEAYLLDGMYYFKNIFALYSSTKCKQEVPLLDILPGALIPPVINTRAGYITDTAKSHADIDFWQYPCATEKQAYESHLLIEHGDHVDWGNKVIHTYLPVPWATYIDKQDFTSVYLKQLSNILGEYRGLAIRYGFALRVHTVCQHIHWERILPVAKELGVTHLHLSHKYSTSQLAQADHGIQLCGWPLIAVNFVTPSRSAGMKRKSMADRQLLASFVGAHMPHYRDQSRIELFEAAKIYGGKDVFVDLGNEWHFNKVVYEEQVLNNKVEQHYVDEHNEKTFRYNAILSDSKFSLCPEGAGPNTLRLWESIAVGAIPVLFSTDLAVFHDSKFGRALIENCIVWDSVISENLFTFLASISSEKLSSMQSKLLELYKVFESFSYLDSTA